MDIAEILMTMLILMGLAVLRFGVPLLAIWLINQALLKLAPSPIETTKAPVS